MEKIEQYWAEDGSCSFMYAHGLIGYVSTRAMHPDVAAAVENRLITDGRTPDEFAGALRVHTRDGAMATLP